MSDNLPGLPPRFQDLKAPIEEKFQQGLALARQRRFEEALAAFKSCLSVAARERIPLFVDEFVIILMEIAFCYADLSNWDEAFRTYDAIERVLKREGDWLGIIPKGVSVKAREHYDALPQLAALYESMGIAYDRTDQVAQAMDYYRRAIDIFTRLDDRSRAAVTWHYVAIGSRRREDWDNLRLAGENLLALHQPVGNLNGMIEAWRCLAQASFNQGRMLEMLEYHKRAVAAERQLSHPDLARDEDLLRYVVNETAALLRRKVAGQQKPKVPSPFDRGESHTNAELFEKIRVQPLTERGSPQLAFVVQTRRFDAAAYLLRIFRLSLLPVNIPLLRGLPLAPDVRLPEGGDLMIEWSLADPDPVHVIDSTLIPYNLHDHLEHINTETGGFVVVLEEKQGRFGKTRSAAIPGRYEPYVIDWGGALGYFTYIRAAWRAISQEGVDLLLRGVRDRLANKEFATGLFTEMGYLHKLNGDWDLAAHCYLQEIRRGLNSDGRPGLGAMQAFCNLGVVYKQLGDLTRARDCFTLALFLNPNYFEPLLSVGGVLTDLDLQLMCLSRAYCIRPQDPMIGKAIQNLCGDRTMAFDEVARWVQEMGSEMDLAQPLAALHVEDPVPVLRRLGF